MGAAAVCLCFLRPWFGLATASCLSSSSPFPFLRFPHQIPGLGFALLASFFCFLLYLVFLFLIDEGNFIFFFHWLSLIRCVRQPLAILARVTCKIDFSWTYSWVFLSCVIRYVNSRKLWSKKITSKLKDVSFQKEIGGPNVKYQIYMIRSRANFSGA